MIMAIDVKHKLFPHEAPLDVGELVENVEDYLAFRVALGC